MARVVAEPAEGLEIIRQMNIYERVCPDLARLFFRVDVSACPSADDIENFLNGLHFIHSDIDCCVEYGRLIEFDYFVTREILQDVRSLLDVYTSSAYKFRLICWRYGE